MVNAFGLVRQVAEIVRGIGAGSDVGGQQRKRGTDLPPENALAIGNVSDDVTLADVQCRDFCNQIGIVATECGINCMHTLERAYLPAPTCVIPGR